MMKLKPPTKRQLELERYLRDHFAKNETAPSNPEIARALGVTENAVRVMLKRLVARGRLRIIPRSDRMIRLLHKEETRAA